MQGVEEQLRALASKGKDLSLDRRARAQQEALQMVSALRLSCDVCAFGGSGVRQNGVAGFSRGCHAVAILLIIFAHRAILFTWPSNVWCFEKQELDGYIAADCPLCGYVMIQSLSLSLITDTDAEEAKAWAI